MFKWLKSVFWEEKQPLKVSILHARIAKIYKAITDKSNCEVGIVVHTCLGERKVQVIESSPTLLPIKSYVLHYIKGEDTLFSMYTVLDEDNSEIDIVEQIFDEDINDIDIDLALLELEEILHINSLL